MRNFHEIYIWTLGEKNSLSWEDLRWGLSMTVLLTTWRSLSEKWDWREAKRLWGKDWTLVASRKFLAPTVFNASYTFRLPSMGISKFLFIFELIWVIIYHWKTIDLYNPSHVFTLFAFHLLPPWFGCYIWLVIIAMSPLPWKHSFSIS